MEPPSVARYEKLVSDRITVAISHLESARFRHKEATGKDHDGLIELIRHAMDVREALRKPS